MTRIDYVSSTALTPINLHPYTEHGGGGFKKMVAVVAAVAIPMAAPAIAGAIGLSGAIGSVMGSALVGGALGAVAGKITGTGATSGALFGALGGGLSGYMNPGTTTTTMADGSTLTYDNSAFSGSQFRPDATGGYQANFDSAVMGAGNQGTVAAVNDPTVSQDLTGGGTTQGGVNQQLSNTNTVSNVQPSGPGDMGANVDTISAQNANIDPGLQANYTVQGNTNVPLNANTTAVNTTAVNTPPNPNANPYNYQMTGNYGEDLVGLAKARFTNPAALVDVGTQAAITVLGSKIFGVGELSDEEKENLRLQNERLEELKQRDEAAYNAAMKAANAYFEQGENFDPSYFARQAYMQTQNKGARAEAQALASMPGIRNSAARAAEARRFQLGTAAAAGSAYDRGYQSGLKRKGDYYQRAVSTFPGAGATQYDSALTGLNQTYANLAQRRSDEQKGFNQMFGAFSMPGTGEYEAKKDKSGLNLFIPQNMFNGLA